MRSAGGVPERPGARAASRAYNAAKGPARTIDRYPSGSDPFRWTFGYGRDALGQVSSSTDQLPGVRKSYGYNSINQLTSQTTSNRAQTTWSYDGAGNLTGMQDTGSNVTETFGYDSGDNQLTSLQATGSNPFGESYTYNADGDRTGMNGTQSATYGYDQANELTSFRQGSTSASYAYSGDGLRMSKTVNGNAEGYVWDEAEGMPLIIQDGSTKYLTSCAALSPGSCLLSHPDTTL